MVADYKKQQKNEVDLTAGDLVEVFEKNDNGNQLYDTCSSDKWLISNFNPGPKMVPGPKTVPGPKI